MKNILWLKKWFTLIELLVMISLIWILAMWISNISFKKNVNRDRLEKLSWNIYNIIEEIRNYALLWKWIWPNLITPKRYKLNVSKTNSWTITTYYLSWSTYNIYNTFDTIEQENIKEIKCLDINWWNEDNSISDLDLIYEWDTLTLSWCTQDSHRKVEILAEYKWYAKSININSVSWLIDISSFK